MKWLKEVEAWLLPIKANCGDASYEASAIDLTLAKVKELEGKLLDAATSLELVAEKLIYPPTMKLEVRDCLRRIKAKGKL